MQQFACLAPVRPRAGRVATTSAVYAAEIPAKNRRIAAGGAVSLRAYGAQFARPVRTNELATGEVAEHL